MNIKQLEAFVAITRHGSFAEAANRLNLTQSAISVRIKELEQDLDVALFDRSRRQVCLTPKGRELLGYADRVISLQREIHQKIGSPDALSGIVRIGVAELIAVTWLPMFTAMARERHPGLTLEFEVAMNPSMLNGVRSGDLDLAFIISTDAAHDLRSCDLGRVRFAWIAGTSFELPERLMTMDDLAHWPILYQGTDSFMRNLVSSILKLPGRSQRTGTSCNSLAALTSLTIAGIGVSLLPVVTSERDIKEGRLRIIPTVPPNIDLSYAAVCADAVGSPAVNALMELATEASNFRT